MPINRIDFEYIRQLVSDRSGVLLTEDKTYLVESRLTPLLKIAEVSSIAQLIAKLRQQPFNNLHWQAIEAMMTAETSFFRDQHPFEALKLEVLPELLKRRERERHLNIWCAACSSGQEPYSIAMLLEENFPQLANWTVKLIATDISKQTLDRARQGSYSQHEISRGLPLTLKHKYFQPVGDRWEIKSKIRQRVDFRQLNLIEPWPFMTQIDVIFLRNVLIYFEIETKRSILAKIRQILRPDGYLFLGGGETTINIDRDLEPLQLNKVISYIRKV